MGNSYQHNLYFSKNCLYSAIEGGDMNWLQAILQKNPQYVNERIDGESELTPLQRAVWRNDFKVRADVNLQIDEGHSATMWASKRNHIEMLQFLLDECKADPYLINKLQGNYNILDYAIQFGNYNTALFIISKYQLEPKNVEVYNEFKLKNNLNYYDYKIIIDHLKNRISLELVPTFNIKSQQQIIYEDPVIDPRETWKQFIKRIVEFEDPPLVERNQLPYQLQPQNTFMGKFRQIINGQSINKEDQKQQKQQNVKIQQQDDSQIQLEDIKISKI